MYKSNLRFLHDKFSQFEVDFLFELEKNGDEGVQLPNCMYLMAKRILDSGYCDRRTLQSGGVFVSGMAIHPDLFIITQKGREFVSDIKSSYRELGDSSEYE